MDSSGEDADGLGIWRSLSEMDLSAMGKEAIKAQQSVLREDPEAEADKEVLRLGMEKEETESSDDNTTQYSIHPHFDFPYFLLLQGYSHRQVSDCRFFTLPPDDLLVHSWIDLLKSSVCDYNYFNQVRPLGLSSFSLLYVPVIFVSQVLSASPEHSVSVSTTEKITLIWSCKAQKPHPLACVCD